MDQVIVNRRGFHTLAKASAPVLHTEVKMANLSSSKVLCKLCKQIGYNPEVVT